MATYYIEGFDALKFSKRVLDKFPSFAGEVNLSKNKGITLIKYLGEDTQKIIANTLFLMEKFPDYSDNEIIELIKTEKQKRNPETFNEMEFSINVMYAGDFLTSQIFIDYGAEKLAKIFCADNIGTEYFRDNFEVGDLIPESETKKIRDYTEKYLRNT